MTSARERKGGEEGQNVNMEAYELRANTLLFHAVSTAENLIPDPSGELGYGFYCTDVPELLDRFVLPQIQKGVMEVRTGRITKLFRLDSSPTMGELQKISRLVPDERKTEVKVLLKELRKCLEVIS